MNGYAVESWWRVADCAAVCGALCAAGLALSRRAHGPVGRATAWALLPAAIAAVSVLAAAEPVGVRMLVLIGATWCAMKGIVTVEAAAQHRVVLPPGRWCAFVLWGGMRVRTLAGRRERRPDAGRYLREGAGRAALGAALLVVASVLASELAATALALVGLSFVLHFGLFRIHTGLFRWAGFDCRALFRNPLRSSSLREFWGRRWNLGFTQMLQDSFYGKFAARFGTSWATLAAFVVSGALHEVAISLPPNAGFGGPLLYFLLHGVLVEAERAASRRGVEIEEMRVVGRLWTFAALVLPLPLLFHAPFLDGAVRPLLGR